MKIYQPFSNMNTTVVLLQPLILESKQIAIINKNGVNGSIRN